jgi:hypothetical protein
VKRTLSSLGKGKYSCEEEEEEAASIASTSHSWSSRLEDLELCHVYCPLSGVWGRDAIDIVLDEVTHPGSISRLFGGTSSGDGR